MNATALLILISGTLATLMGSTVLAQTIPDHPHTSSHQMEHSQHMMNNSDQHMMSSGRQATLPGQDAFGAMQEIISILESDPNTDWSRVNISALREHLVDMNRLVMDTEVVETEIEGGLSMTVSGPGSTLKTIHAMIPAHAPMINGLNGWNSRAQVSTNSATLTVTASSKKEIAHIRGLGFYGLMTSGAHHQTHHLGLARGENVHGK